MFPVRQKKHGFLQLLQFPPLLKACHNLQIIFFGNNGVMSLPQYHSIVVVVAGILKLIFSIYIFFLCKTIERQIFLKRGSTSTDHFVRLSIRSSDLLHHNIITRPCLITIVNHLFFLFKKQVFVSYGLYLSLSFYSFSGAQP